MVPPCVGETARRGVREREREREREKGGRVGGTMYKRAKPHTQKHCATCSHALIISNYHTTDRISPCYGTVGDLHRRTRGGERMRESAPK